LVLAFLCLQNVYKIFYSQATDGTVLNNPDLNPWKSEVCQSLPVQTVA
jgi:hypothetical protein